MAAITPQTFAEVNVSERGDLQKLFRNNVAAIEQAINDKLFIISEEYSYWKESDRRVDLLALDKGEHSENSAIVTANSCSS